MSHGGGGVRKVSCIIWMVPYQIDNFRHFRQSFALRNSTTGGSDGRKRINGLSNHDANRSGISRVDSRFTEQVDDNFAGEIVRRIVIISRHGTFFLKDCQIRVEFGEAIFQNINLKQIKQTNVKFNPLPLKQNKREWLNKSKYTRDSSNVQPIMRSLTD